MSEQTPAFKDCAVSKPLENIISERLRQYEIALSILAEYPRGLERFRAAIKQDNKAVSPTSPQASTDDTPRRQGMSIIND